MDNIVARAKAYVETHREALIDQATVLLKQWHGQPGLTGDLVYQLNDQDYFDDLWDGFVGTNPDTAEDILLELNSDDFGMNLPIWIEAATRLGFTDYVDALKLVQSEGL